MLDEMPQRTTIVAPTIKLPEICLIEVENERAGRCGNDEQRTAVVLGRRGNTTAVAAEEVAAANAVAIFINSTYSADLNFFCYPHSSLSFSF